MRKYKTYVFLAFHFQIFPCFLRFLSSLGSTFGSLLNSDAICFHFCCFLAIELGSFFFNSTIDLCLSTRLIKIFFSSSVKIFLLILRCVYARNKLTNDSTSKQWKSVKLWLMRNHQIRRLYLSKGIELALCQVRCEYNLPIATHFTWKFKWDPLLTQVRVKCETLVRGNNTGQSLVLFLQDRRMSGLDSVITTISPVIEDNNMEFYWPKMQSTEYGKSWSHVKFAVK